MNKGVDRSMEKKIGWQISMHIPFFVGVVSRRSAYSLTNCKTMASDEAKRFFIARRIL